jgi:hypothetical protein
MQAADGALAEKRSLAGLKPGQRRRHRGDAEDTEKREKEMDLTQRGRTKARPYMGKNAMRRAGLKAQGDDPEGAADGD